MCFCKPSPGSGGCEPRRGIGRTINLRCIATSFAREILQSLWPDPQQPQNRVNEQLAQQGPNRMIHSSTSLSRNKNSSLD